jgi:DMSO/TMAO reductase YedYZ molybdopterin-dependent catalytic subunit/thiosulfate reductase cytochrome b subunit
MPDVPAYVRATHLLDIVFLSLLARSGPQILSSMPRLWWGHDSDPGREWLRIGARTRPPDARVWTSLQEEVAWPSWLVLPGGRRLGLGRHWHFVGALGWLLTGACYLLGLFVSGDWRTLVPTSWSIVPDAMHAASAYLHLHEPTIPPGASFNALQQLVYAGVVFVLAPLAILTGLGMSPALGARWPRALRAVGGVQTLRSIHFLAFVAILGFTLVHTVMVVLHGLPSQFARIFLGSEHHDHLAGLLVGVAALVAVALLHVVATAWSVRDPAGAAAALGTVSRPLLATLGTLAAPRPARERPPSRSFPVNGAAPTDDWYRQLARDGFADWRVEVGGLVDRPASYSLAQLRELGEQRQVTCHHCIQGWTATAQWSGVPVQLLLDACGPQDAARFAVFHGYDDKAETAVEGEADEGRYYATLPLHVLSQPTTILAWEMNGEPLPVAHGAPLRLRAEGQLGIKMVKWLVSIELVASVAHIGKGRGGWREDHQHFDTRTSI